LLLFTLFKEIKILRCRKYALLRVAGSNPASGTII
jgi:hypothetical protein